MLELVRLRGYEMPPVAGRLISDESDLYRAEQD
jgi:hypothetical protein